MWRRVLKDKNILFKINMFPFDVYGLTQRSVPAAAVEVTGVCVLKTLIS